MKRKDGTEIAPAPKGKRGKKQSEGDGDGTGTQTALEAVNVGTLDTEADVDLPPIQFRVVDHGIFSPQELLDLVIDEKANGRKSPHTAAKIADRAKDLLEKGQMQPVVCVRRAGLLRVVFGFLRSLAARHIQDNSLMDPPYAGAFTGLRYEEWEMSDDDLMTANAEENLKRDPLNGADMLHLIQHYSKRGLTGRAIANRLGIPESQISRDKSLEKLNVREIKSVSLGKISTEQARELAAMEPETRKPYVDRILAGEEVTTQELRAGQTRKRQTGTSDAGGGKNGKGAGAGAAGETDHDARSLNAKAIGLPFEYVANKVEEGAEPDAIQVWAAQFIKFREGKLKASTLFGKLYETVQIDKPSWLRQLDPKKD